MLAGKITLTGFSVPLRPKPQPLSNMVINIVFFFFKIVKHRNSRLKGVLWRIIT
jgi:hypothetical protein